MSKIAISLPKETLAQARRAVRKGYAASMSAYVAKAIEQKAQSDDLDVLLTEMLEATGGPMTPTEIAETDALLDRATPPLRRRRRK